MSSGPDEANSWERVLCHQGIARDVIDRARSGAQRMVKAAEEIDVDPARPIGPEAFAQQLVCMAAESS